MADHVIASVPVTPPVSAAEIPTLDYTHTLYLQAYVDGSATVTFVEADNYSGLIPGAFALASSSDSTERVMLSGQRQRGKRTVTVDNQTVRVEAAFGTPKFATLGDRSFNDDAAANQGEPLVFFRGYPDGRAQKGICYVEKMDAEGDPEADQFGYDLELSFVNVEWFDARQPVAP